MTVREYLKETNQDVAVRVILRILSKIYIENSRLEKSVPLLSKDKLEVIKSILDMDIEEFNKDITR